MGPVRIGMFILKLFSRLPLDFLYRVSGFLYFTTYYIVRYRRKLVWRNLQNSFPNKSQTELRQIEKQFYRNLCDYAIETLKLLTIGKEELGERMRFEKTEILEQYKIQQKSVILLTAHLFNWEWMLASGSFSLPLPVDFVYQKVNNKFFDSFSLFLRSRFGAYGIERSQVARETIRRKNLQRGIAIVADQYPGHKTDKKYPVRFLNQDSVFFLGGNQLAVMTQYPVVYFAIKRLRRGYYTGTFYHIAEPPFDKHDTRVLDNYVVAVEKSIIEDPANWLWSHQRWKTRHLRHRQKPE